MMNRILMPIILMSTMVVGPAVVDAAQVVVDQPAVCVECHSDIQESFQRPHVHTAFAEGECSSCHNPHASKHANLLRADVGKLCLDCHEDLAQLATEPVVHQPAAAGECTSCHDPHASDYNANTVAALPGLCEKCHAEVANWFDKDVVHPPLEDDGCMACHLPHSGTVPSLLREAVPALCMKCHTADADFDQVHGGRSLAGTDCTACHDPHASTDESLLRSNQHKPFAAGQCERCHSGLKTGQSFALGKPVADLCLECHKTMVAGGKATHPHIMNTTKACVSCHNPHASNEEKLLLAPQVKLCMGCHFNDEGAGDKAKYITHDGMDCVNCHQPHGGEFDKLLIRNDSDLCARCHEQAHQTTHPVGPEVIDPRTEEPVTCMSCHKLHGSDFPFYLPLNPDMELCLQCHKK